MTEFSTHHCLRPAVFVENRKLYFHAIFCPIYLQTEALSVAKIQFHSQSLFLEKFDGFTETFFDDLLISLNRTYFAL